MGLVYRLKKGSALSYSEMDANLATLSSATGSSVTGSSISGLTQTFHLGDGTSYTNTIASASYALKAVSASYSSYAFDSATATSASYAISASHVEFADDAHLSVTASYAVSASHVEFADDAHLSVTSSHAISASHAETADLAALATQATTATTATSALSVSGSIEAVSFDSSGSFHISGSDVIFSGLSTTEPSTTGSLWLSGSGAGAASGSKYLMVFMG